MIQLRAMFVVCALLITAAFGQPFWGEYQVNATPGGGSPTLITSQATAFNNGTTPKAFTSVNLQSGDIVILAGVIENGQTATAPEFTENGAATIATLYGRFTGGDVGVHLAQYTATTTETVTFNTINGGSGYFGAGLWQFRGATGGLGTAVSAVGDGEPSFNITTASANSSIVIMCGDWAALTGTATWRTNAGAATELVSYGDGTNYGVHMAHHQDAGSAGTYALGLSAPTGQDYVCAAVEVKP